MATRTLTIPLPVRSRNDPCCADVVRPSLSEDTTAHVAGQLKAVADPTRLRMLDLIAQQPQPICVCDITPHFAQNQPTISHHLRLLREAGLIDTDKRGIWSYYWITENGRRLLETVSGLA